MLGPKRMKPNYLYIYHWKLNSISAVAKNSIYKHDFICLSETYPDLITLLNDNSLQIEGYNLV